MAAETTGASMDAEESNETHGLHAGMSHLQMRTAARLRLSLPLGEVDRLRGDICISSTMLLIL